MGSLDTVMDPPSELVRVVGQGSPANDRHKFGAYTGSSSAAKKHSPVYATSFSDTDTSQDVLVCFHVAIGYHGSRTARHQDVCYSLAPQLLLAPLVEFLRRYGAA